MGNNIPKEALDHIGQQSTRKYIVNERDIKRFAQAIGDNNPLYFDKEYAAKTRYGGIVAPPLFYQSLSYDDIPLSGLPSDNSPAELNIPLPATRTVGGSSEYEIFERAKPGDEITITTELKGVFTKEGRSGKLYFIEILTQFYLREHQLVAREIATFIKRL